MTNLMDLQRYARYAAECWSNPGQFKTPQEFLAALTEVLNELANAAGKPVPDLERVWREKYGMEL